MKILGHRGYKTEGKPYQNTYEAISLALQEGADGVELDILTNAQGICYLSHDDEIEIHSDLDNGKISELTKEEIATKRVGFNGEYFQISKLEPILKLFKNDYSEKLLNIEIKQEGITGLIAKEIEQSGIDKTQIIISCFEHSELEAYRKIDKDIKLGILFEGDKPKSYIQYVNELAKKLAPTSIHPDIESNIFDVFIDAEKYFWTVKEGQLDKLEGIKNLNIIVDSIPKIKKVIKTRLETKK